MASYLSFSNWNSDGHSPYAFTNSASASASSFIISSLYSSIALEIKFRPTFGNGEGVYPCSTWVFNVNTLRMKC